MADKQATIYVVDLGSTTGECHNGRVASDLDYGMSYVWDKIATTMSANKASWNVGVIGFRTDETDNPLDSEGYENITVLKPLGAMEMTSLEELRGRISSSNTETGDAVSAIVVAIHLIDKFTTLKSGKPGKFGRKVVLLTDGQGSIDDDNIEPIAEKINESGIELVVIGIDFDDADFGFKEEDKSSVKRQNEGILKSLVDSCTNGLFGTAAEALESLANPEVKTSRPYSTYEGRLGLGDFAKYPETAMYIDVKRYFKTKAAKPPSASSFVTRRSVTNGEASAQSSHTIPGDIEMTDAPSDDLSAVRNARTYKVNDVSAPGGKRDVDREELAKGYQYGRTAVPFSESDDNVIKLETIQSFSIIGFVPSDKYEKYLNMGESCITIAQPVNDKARMAMSSLVHALHELESYAVARIVLKNGKDPLIILLAPSIEPDLEALVDVPLPFAEDVRVYRFPPLDKVIGSSGAALQKHRYLPSKDLVGAMSDYVDSMDLSTFSKDDEGEPAEYMTIEETYSPTVHRINQAIRQRAIHPGGSVSPPADVLMKWEYPPLDLVAQSSAQLEALMAASSVTKVAAKAKSKRGIRETITPLSGLDINALLSGDQEDISSENAIPDFLRMLSTTEDDSSVVKAANKMEEAIRRLIKNSTADGQYEQAIANMVVLRAQMVDFEMPDTYNDFCRDLRRRIFNGELNGDRRDFWLKLRYAKLGLIDSGALAISDISEQEATEFYSLQTELPTRTKE